MFSGALLGLKEEAYTHLKENLNKIPLKDFETSFKTVDKKGVTAGKFNVHHPEQHHHRYYLDIVKLFNESVLNSNTKNIALKIVHALGQSEAQAHETTIEKVHFHEVGAIDSIVDIASAAILLDYYQIDTIYTNAVTIGHGEINYCHGKTTLPVPAVKFLLSSYPKNILNIAKEFTTPTGAAIIKAMEAKPLEQTPPLPDRVGIGAGDRDLDFPNILKAYLFDDFDIDEMILLQTTIDDINPELIPEVIDELITHGAIDAWSESCLMKKNRTGFNLNVLTNIENSQRLQERLFKSSTTIGIRCIPINRTSLKRDYKTLETEYGNIRIKSSSYNGTAITTKPELEDCRIIANNTGIPISVVYKNILERIKESI
jgi:uncharacterized protein (TIGR00299 family) protein